MAAFRAFQQKSLIAKKYLTFGSAIKFRRLVFEL